ncbi:MAG: hypothetical protein L6R41_001069 [Letrouitia leprolyta]|nr:MAG: hypothetical protein L6R41_001069 [Letrouitia leprolyta]
MVKYYSRNYFDDEMTELLAAHIIPKATVRVETAEEEHKKLDLVDALMDPHLGSQKRIATHQVTNKKQKVSKDVARQKGKTNVRTGDLETGKHAIPKTD